MKKETCELQIRKIQSFLERHGVDPKLMQFEFLEKANRVYFIAFADPILSRAGFVSCNQDPWKMQDAISSQLKMGNSVFVYDAPASSSSKGFNITPGLLDQHPFRVNHIVMHEILNTHLKNCGYDPKMSQSDGRKVDAIMEGLTEWLVSSLLIAFFEKEYPVLTSDLRAYINIELISKYHIINKLFVAMQNSDAETILQLQALYWREGIAFFNAIYPGPIKRSRYGTAISGPKDISPAYVFLLSRYATSFMVVQRVAQKHQLIADKVVRNPAQYKNLFLESLEI